MSTQSDASQALANVMDEFTQPMSVEEMHQCREAIGEMLGVEMTALVFAPLLGRTNVWMSQLSNPKKNPDGMMPEPYPLLVRLIHREVALTGS